MRSYDATKAAIYAQAKYLAVNADGADVLGSDFKGYFRTKALAHDIRLDNMFYTRAEFS